MTHHSAVWPEATLGQQIVAVTHEDGQEDTTLVTATY
jgi:hypothetical protein